MIAREWRLTLWLLGLAILAGCGSSHTDENVPEKVFTEKELQEIRDGQKRLSELGGNGLPPPGAPQSEPSKGGR